MLTNYKVVYKDTLQLAVERDAEDYYVFGRQIETLGPNSGQLF